MKLSVVMPSDRELDSVVCFQNIMKDTEKLKRWLGNVRGSELLSQKDIIYNDNVFHSLKLVSEGRALCLIPQYMLSFLDPSDRKKLYIKTIEFQEYLYHSCSKDKFFKLISEVRDIYTPSKESRCTV
jgi:hypothetical protein